MESDIDYFLLNSAYFLHWDVLGNNWKEDNEGKTWCSVAFFLGGSYIMGMVGHLCSLVAKIGQFALFLIVDIGLFFHYLFASFERENEGIESQNRTERWKRFVVARHITGEALLSAAIDCIGLVCPPFAYRLHGRIEQTITCPAVRVAYPNFCQGENHDESPSIV